MLNKIKKCFDITPVNFGRQKELDIAKGIAIFLMTISHGIEILGWFFDPNISSNFSWGDFDSVIKAAAPIFIFCMGISFCYSRNQSAEWLARRALRLAGMAVLLELFRTVIPTFIEFLFFHDFDSIKYAHQVFCVDIFQFSTLVLFLIALFKKINLKPVTMLVVSIGCSIIGQLLAGGSTGSVIGDYLAGFLWYSHDMSYFPLLNWLIIPVLGYSVGYLWIRIKDKDTLFKWITPIGLIIVIGYFMAMIMLGEWYYFSSGKYNGIGIIDSLFTFVVFLTITGISHFIGKFTSRISTYLQSLGSRVSSVYCIHWTIYAFLYLVLRVVIVDRFIPLWTVIPTGLTVLIAADCLSRLYKKNKKGLIS
jgi:uncharacterized membrane protein